MRTSRQENKRPGPCWHVFLKELCYAACGRHSHFSLCLTYPILIAVHQTDEPEVRSTDCDTALHSSNMQMYKTKAPTRQKTKSHKYCDFARSFLPSLTFCGGTIRSTQHVACNMYVAGYVGALGGRLARGGLRS